MISKPNSINQSLLNVMYQQRILVAIGLMLLVFLTFTVRMVYLQLFEHEHYKKLSNDNRIDIVSLAPTRGLLWDRNGILLADNKPDYGIDIIPEKVKNLKALLKKIKKYTDISADEEKSFFKRLGWKRRFDSVLLKSSLTPDEIAKISIDLHQLPGVKLSANLNRYYPLGESFSHVLGFTGVIDQQEIKKINTSNYAATRFIGKQGIEKVLEDELHGQVGFKQVEVDVHSRPVRTIQESLPIPGKSIHLSIDARLQYFAYNQLAPKRGSIIAISPKSGEILAMATSPSFDNNQFAKGISHQDYKILTDNKNRPLFHRAISAQYPPGSTIKPFMALLNLRENAIHKNHYIYDPGYYRIAGRGRQFRDWKKSGHGSVDLHKAIVISCDTYFYQVAERIGIDTMHAFFTKIGFDHALLPGWKEEANGLMPSTAWKKKAKSQPWYRGETVIAGIGQGYVLVTPLQLAYSTAWLASNGKLNTLSMHLDGSHPVDTLPPNYFKASDWEFVHRATRDVVHGGGTASKAARGIQYQMAGKTGTAQVFSLAPGFSYNADEIAEHLHDHGLFIAYAPAHDPVIAVATIIENGGSGSAVMPTREVIDYYLHSLQHQGLQP